MRQIQLRVAQIGLRLFRNNVGMGWIGQVIKPSRVMTIRVSPNDVVLRNARPLHAGLCEGSGDLIGWFTLKITPEMIGKSVAVFGSLEIKEPNGRISEIQKRFIKTVRQAGGFADVARSEDEALSIFHEWRPS